MVRLVFVNHIETSLKNVWAFFCLSNKIAFCSYDFLGCEESASINDVCAEYIPVYLYPGGDESHLILDAFYLRTTGPRATEKIKKIQISLRIVTEMLSATGKFLFPQECTCKFLTPWSTFTLRPGVMHGADSCMGRTPPKVLTILTQC